MALRPISALETSRLVAAGALLVDVRERDEFARERIPHARSQPMSSLPDGPLDVGGASRVIFHCRSGGRTQAHGERLARLVPCEACVLEGGLDAWKKAGLPVIADRSQPLELMRQVQLVAGGAVLTSVVLGATLSPWFYALAAFVGGGLVVAGATGFCGLATLLQRMPWNRRAAG